MVGLYLPIAKVDREQRMVWGYASTPTRDLDGEVIALEAIRQALPGYMQWRNVREMHQPSAVGVAEEANVDATGLYLGARIVDDDAWKKVVGAVYKGFSIGGNVTDRDGSTITGLELIEISLVDRPANPDCRIEVIKAAAAGGEAGREAGVTLEREEIGLIGRLLAKLAGTGAGRKGKEPDGDGEYADPGYRADGKKRYPIESEENIRAAWSYIHEEKNAAEYTPEQLAAIRRRIIAAWRRVIDPEGPPAAEAAARDEGGDISPGVERMAEGDLGRRAAEGAHTGHLKKAMQHLGEAHKCLGAGMACVARAERSLGAKDDAKDDAAGGAAHELAHAARHFERAQESHVLAHHHLAAMAGGHAGERGEEPGDAEAGLYAPEAGLAPLGLDQMTEGRVPDYAVDRPYPGKSACARFAAEAATLTKREADALAEAAYLRGKVEALEKAPSSPRAKLFAVPRGAFGVSEAEEPSTVETLLKGVNLDATGPAERQAAGARMIANMITGGLGRAVIGDPSFRGGAGAGRSAR